MVQDLEDIMVAALGLGSAELNLWQMLLRALAIYVVALTLVRVGETRLLDKNTAFDVILGIILGSVMSRAINGSAPLLETVGAGAALVALHWLFAALAVHSNIFSRLLKCRATLLVRDGEVQPGGCESTILARMTWRRPCANRDGRPSSSRYRRSTLSVMAPSA